VSSIGQHAEILLSGPVAWNAWRKKKPAVIPDLSGLVLAASERELSGGSDAPLNLKSARLDDAVFRFATLTAANLQAADLARADLTHAHFARADLSDANLHRAALDHADFSKAKLAGADLRRATLRFALLAGADLEGADLSQADLAHARLTEANLAGTSFRGAVLDYADFAGANLSETDFSGARLCHAGNLSPSQLEKSFGDDTTILPPHLQGRVSWSTAAVVPPFLGFDRGMVSVSGTRHRDKRTFYRRTARAAGVLALGAAVATILVSDTQTDTPQAGPVEQKSGEAPRLLLPVGQDDLQVLRAAAPRVPETPPLVVRPRLEFAALQAPVSAAEHAPPVAAAELKSVAPAADRLPATNTLAALNGQPKAEILGTVFYPATLALAYPAMSELAGTNAPRELEARSPNLRTVALRKARKLTIVRPAQAVIPLVRAYDDPESGAPASTAASSRAPVLVVISLGAQKVDVYRGLKSVASARISSGMPGHDTKTGAFSILEKKRRHHSNLYSGAPMPWMQRLTRSGTALHAGAIPGYPASHGCVRLPYSFAPKLFEMTKVGDNVVVTHGRPEPRPIAHPNLFQVASANPRVAMAAEAGSLSRRLSDAVEITRASAHEGQDYGALFRSDGPLRILITRRTAHDRVIAVQYVLADLGYLPRQNFTGAFGRATRGAIKAFQTASGLPATGAFTDGLVSQVYQASGKVEPPEGHLYVRQDFNRVFDVPIALRRPEVPLGTHVFTVVKREGAEASPEWMVVSLDGDASSALDRLDVPDEVRRSITVHLTPGSTLIVADRSEYSAILPEGDDFLVSSSEPAGSDDAKAEQAEAGPARTDTVKPPRPHAAKARPAKPRAATSVREMRRRNFARPSPFGLPYLFGR
jgi:uncharacterized protein YjbI with pentapeptide repeats/lipoprotein-anchoring transpeptidase ErfK/SrfK/peptidoglycan hydrolase-like protein with peptidoglycan-binding domain